MFSKLLNASNHVTTDHIIYLRLDLISDYKKLNNMIDDLRLLKKDKKQFCFTKIKVLFVTR